jgi:hypothetical protein
MSPSIPRTPNLSKPPRVSDLYPKLVSQETRRLTSVTPRLLKSFQESPARFLPRAKALTIKAMAGPRKAF